MAADDYAVVVGINGYPALSNLRGPENDARAVKEWLVDPQGGNVPAKNVKLIVSSDFDKSDEPGEAEPTMVRVQAAFEKLIDVGVEKDPKPVGRRLYIFLAGHGVAPPNDLDDAALLMANAARTRLGHYIAGRPTANYFRGAAYFKEIVLLMDCCRDALPKIPLMPLPWNEANKPDGADVKFFYGFATKWSRRAREQPVEGGPIRGLFTTAVLEGLRKGRHTPKDLEGYVKSRLPQLADPDAYQSPDFLSNADDLELASGEAETKCQLRMTFKKPDAGVTVVVQDGHLKPVAEHPMDDGPWVVDLEPGLYAIARSDQDANSAVPVKVVGGAVDVAI